MGVSRFGVGVSSGVGLGVSSGVGVGVAVVAPEFSLPPGEEPRLGSEGEGVWKLSICGGGWKMSKSNVAGTEGFSIVFTSCVPTSDFCRR